MTDLEAFRDETRAWLEANAPAAIRGLEQDPETGGSWGGRRPRWDHPEMKTWLERAAARGITAPTWPREYGGGGLSSEQAKVGAEEMRKLRLPPPLPGFGLTTIGPAVPPFGKGG